MYIGLNRAWTDWWRKKTNFNHKCIVGWMLKINVFWILMSSNNETVLWWKKKVYLVLKKITKLKFNLNFKKFFPLYCRSYTKHTQYNEPFRVFLSPIFVCTETAILLSFQKFLAYTISTIYVFGTSIYFIAAIYNLYKKKTIKNSQLLIWVNLFTCMKFIHT